MVHTCRTSSRPIRIHQPIPLDRPPHPLHPKVHVFDPNDMITLHCRQAYAPLAPSSSRISPRTQIRSLDALAHPLHSRLHVALKLRHLRHPQDRAQHQDALIVRVRVGVVPRGEGRHDGENCPDVHDSGG
jgi:hypothetical protein